MLNFVGLLAMDALPYVSGDAFLRALKGVFSGCLFIALIAFVVYTLKSTKFMQPRKEEFDENITIQQVKKPQGKVEISDEYKRAIEQRKAMEKRAFEEEYRRAIREGRFEKKSLLDLGKDIKNRINRADRADRKERQERENRK